METILSYLDNMFLNMPKTADVLRAKEELASMMEDKYNELMAEGKKENEAVGIVISEFGNLDELAEELGISGSINSNKVYEEEAKWVSREETEEYMATAEKTNKWIALGVLLCIWSPVLLLLCGGLEENFMLTDFQVVCYGLVPLFLLIGIAVAIFIYNGVKMEKFEYLKKENIQLDTYLRKSLMQMDEEAKTSQTGKEIVGILFCIFSVIPVIVIGSMTDNDLFGALSVIMLLFSVGIGVTILIISNSKKECLKVLLQQGDYTKRSKKKNKIIDIIASIYWPIVTVIYLAWSFTTMQWGISWIVWPIAGVLFGAIAAICSVITQGIDALE